MRAKRIRVDVNWTIAEPSLEAIGVGQGVSGAVGPVDHHGRFIINRNPRMPGNQRHTAFGPRWPYLMKRQDKVVRPDMHLRVAEWPDAGILVTIIGDVDDQFRRLAANERVG